MSLANIKNKIILIGLGLLIVGAGVIFIVRFSTPEDAWLCTANGWEKHGNPSTEMPNDECPEAPRINGQ